MSSALVLATAIVASVAALIGFLGLTSLRSGARSLALWMFGWTAHLGSADSFESSGASESSGTRVLLLLPVEDPPAEPEDSTRD